MTLVEFGMLYQTAGLIELKTQHEGMDVQNRNTTKVSFNLTLSVNPNVSEKVIFTLLNKQGSSNKVNQ